MLHRLFFLFVLAISVGALSGLARAQVSLPANTWVARRQVPPFPAALGAPSKHVMTAYDSDRHLIYLWGGDYCVTEAYGDRCDSHEEFWSYNVATDKWALLLDQAGANTAGFPRGRCLAALAYDSRRKVVWMTSGEERYDKYAPGLVSRGLWAFDPLRTAWTWSNEGPGPDYGDSAKVNTNEVQFMVYDPAADRLIVPGINGGVGSLFAFFSFAGLTLHDGVRNDNWSWTGVAINEPQMGQLKFALDTKRNRLIYYNPCQGGSPCSARVNKLWGYDLASRTSTLLNTQSVVPNESVFGLAYDPVNDAAVLFGGFNNDEGNPSASYINELWVYSFRTNAWSKPALGGAIPSPRKGESLVYDSFNNVLVEVGGTGGFQTGVDQYGYYGDEVFLLRLDLGQTPPPPTTSPTAPTNLDVQ